MEAVDERRIGIVEPPEDETVADIVRWRRIREHSHVMRLRRGTDIVGDSGGIARGPGALCVARAHNGARTSDSTAPLRRRDARSGL
ncbi:hypothetical protein GCM10009700_24850 [Brevibacterium sanguinis]